MKSRLPFNCCGCRGVTSRRRRRLYDRRDFELDELRCDGADHRHLQARLLVVDRRLTATRKPSFPGQSAPALRRQRLSRGAERLKPQPPAARVAD